MESKMFLTCLGIGFWAVVLACLLVRLWRYCKSGEYEQEKWVHVYFD